MAIGMKGWLGIVGAGLTLVALWALPPRAPRLERGTLTPEQRRASALLSEARSLGGTWQARRWADSLSELTVRTAIDGIAVGVHDGGEVTAEGVREWRMLLEEQLHELTRRDDHVALGFYVLRPDQAAAPGSTSLRWWRRTTFVGAHEGTPYCIQVDVIEEPTNLRLRDEARRGVEACRLYAIYGMPGPRIQEWMDAGALGLGVAVGPHSPTQYRPLPIDAPIFGMNRTFTESPESQRCRSGERDACQQVVTDPRLLVSDPFGGAFVVANSPAAHQTNVSSVLAWNDEHLLDDLQQEFGAEAFERFWKSEASVPQAFEATYGLDLGSWVLAWVDEEVGIQRAGPLPSGGSTLWSFVTLTILAAGASAMALRRRVS